MNRLEELRAAGVSIWLDTLSRELLDSGAFTSLIADSAVTGATSNPTIFAKAITTSDRYDEQLRAAAASGRHSLQELFFLVALDDVARAADLLRPTFDAGDRRDGFVSFECTPDLADDSGATVEQALELWHRLERPNVMIKVPATDAGLDAIEELTAHGVNVNVTLLFSVARYEQVIDAYLTGLERRVHAGQAVDGIASVASFFVSRVDASADAMLAPDSSLRGRVAIANARRAYARYVERFAGPRWEALRLHGARLAASAVGEHRHEGRLLLRRPLRRAADRPRRREHDARGHPPRVRRPRPQHAHPVRLGCRTPRRRSAAPVTPASTLPRSPPSSSVPGSAPSATPIASCSARSKRGSHD